MRIEDGVPTSSGEAQAETYKLVKPKCPIVEENTERVDLITPHSFKFFSILGLSSGWLAKTTAQWEEDESFMAARILSRQ